MVFLLVEQGREGSALPPNAARHAASWNGLDRLVLDLDWIVGAAEKRGKCLSPARTAAFGRTNSVDWRAHVADGTVDKGQMRSRDVPRFVSALFLGKRVLAGGDGDQ